MGGAELKVGIVGAGVFGVWIARCLQRAGCSVTVFDQYGPGNSRASSGGETRLLRAGYGPNTIYSEWAIRSHQLWSDALNSLSRSECFVPAGMLWLVWPGDPYGVAIIETLRKLDWPIEIMDRAEVQKRYPVIATPPSCQGILEPRSGALLARRAVAILLAEVIRAGGSFVQARAEVRDDRLLVNGERLAFERIVLSAGPWLPKLLPDVIGNRIQPTRQEIMFFGCPPGRDSFSPSRLPGWIDFTDERMPYGFPDIENRGFKMAFDRHGPSIDPDTEERILSASTLREAREYLASRFPDLAGSPLVDSRVCQYENTGSGDFILDWMPGSSRVFIAGGGSGHGFKHGPAVGEHVANVLMGREALIERFKLPGSVGLTRAVH